MWKEILDTDGLYFVNEKGSVKSADRTRRGVSHGEEFTYVRKGRLLKQSLNRKGYPCVTLKKLDGTQKVVCVHRLVALTFIPNPQNLPQINHIDGIKTNNNVSNLEWCTPQHNIVHAFKMGLNKATKFWTGKKGSNHPASKPVVAFDKTGNRIMEFASATSAADFMKIHSPSHISSCANGRRKSCAGYVWRFKNESPE